MSQADIFDVQYQVNPLADTPSEAQANIQEGLVELERRARRYGSSSSPIFSWKTHGHRYSSWKSLGACIDGIAANAMKARGPCEHGRWLLNISRGEKSALTLALQEGTP